MTQQNSVWSRHLSWMDDLFFIVILRDTYSDSGGGGEGGKIVILCTSISTQIPNHKTSKKNDISNTVNICQAIRQGKLRKITKCLL